MPSLQTSVTYASPIAIPGMVADLNDAFIVSAVCTTSVLPGTWVELTLAADGEKLVAKTPNTAAGVLGDGGVALYDPMQDPQATPALGSTSSISGAGFPAGAVINVLRRGRVFVQTDLVTTAGNATFLSNAKVQHPSTTAASATNTGGYFTAAGATTTAGVETTAQPGVYFERVVDTTNGVALVEVNRPATA